MPLIVGGRFVRVGAVTVIVNAGRDEVARPSLTEIVMSANVPTFALGVPLSLPSVALKVAHAGGLLIENVSGSSSGSLAVGVNVYAVPATTDVVGAPETDGGRFASGPATVKSNAGSNVCDLPSDTHTTI